MSTGDKAAEVAEDYRFALEDLAGNNRFEITNLTVVARENTEFALAIAETLAEHINNVAPQKKLPALYVLDSIVKNVGTPYTLFFGRKLFGIFMGAYATVDSATRKKMDEMLKTWKEPVPGSIDTRPVFPPEVVRPIESALIRARTTALQAQQQSIRGQQQLLNRGRPVPAPYRNTPTPPGMRPGSQQPGMPYGQPPPQNQQGPAMQQSYPMHPNHTPQPQYPPQATPQPAPSAYGAPPYQQPGPGPQGYGSTGPGITLDQVKNDIRQLIDATTAQFQQTPHDGQIPGRLNALIDLQRVVETSSLNQEQLVLVKNQVASLAVNIRPVAAAAPQPAYPLQQPYQHQQSSTPVPPVVAVAPPPPSQSAPPVQAASGAPLSLDKLLGQGALAQLLAGMNKPAGTATPPVPAPPTPVPVAAVRSPVPQPALATAAAPTPPTQDPSALLNMLRQSGMLPPLPPAGVPSTSSAPPPMGGLAPPPPLLPQGRPLPQGLPAGLDLASILASVKNLPVPGFQPQYQQLPNDPAADIQLTHHSLKQFRPHLLHLLHEDLGPPCTQCGRRFRNNDEGKRKKTAHMDWHFRVHQRIAEAEKRGMHRSWYVDEKDWVHSREVIDATTEMDGASSAFDGQNAADGGMNANNSQRPGKHQQAKKLQYIPVPDDGKVNSVCPICQEEFEMKWLDEAQEWVWMDVLRVGDRAYHASCYGEASVAKGGRTGTPDGAAGVLGKRKAEDGLDSGVRGRVKLEY